MFHDIRRSTVSILHNFYVFLLGHNTFCIEIFQTPQCFLHNYQEEISRMRTIYTMVLVSEEAHKTGPTWPSAQLPSATGVFP